MSRKHLLTLLATAGLLAVPTAASAGEGDATAVGVDGVVTISQSHAEDGSSSSTGLSVLGEEVTGSSQQGEGSTSGGYGGGEEGMGSATVLGSESTVNGDGSSESSASAVDAEMDGAAHVQVLRSEANSNGDAESDGVYANFGGGAFELHLLHAESNGGVGNAAVAIIGGEPVLESGADGGLICPLDGAPVVAADIVCASGARAGIVDNAAAGDGNVTGQVITANSGPATATPPFQVPVASPAPSGPATPPGLARTGLDVLALLAMAGGTIVVGDQLRRRAQVPAISFA